MFPVETFPPTYYEERTAAEAATRLAQQQKAGAAAAAAADSKALSAAAPLQQPSSLAHAFSQPPALARNGSSGVLGRIFQGLARRESSPSITPAATPPRQATPASHSEQQSKEVDALMAEMKRDADICALPGWH